MATKDITDLDVVTAYRDSLRQDRFPDEILHARSGEPKKVCLRAMERAERRGLIEYGVSLLAGWLTAAGLELLEASENER